MSSKNAQFMGTEPTGKLLLRLSLPAGIGMIVNALYNLTDAIFVGQGTGPLGLAGLSIAFPIQMLASAFALTIGMGSAALISLRLGEKKPEQAARIAVTAVLSALIVSLVYLGLLATFLKPVLRTFGATENILPYAVEYIGTVMWGFPIVGSLMTGNNLLRSVGKAKQAMVVMIIGTGVNMILDPLFIFPKGEFLIGYFGMGIQGAAVATVISQGMSLLYLLHLYIRKTIPLPVRKVGIRFHGGDFAQTILLGLPTLVRNAGTSLMVLIVNNSLAQYGGDLAISSFGIINRLMMFTLMPIFGVIQGFQPIAGYNFGARLFDRVKKITYQALAAATALSLFSFLLMFLFPRFLLRLFTQDQQLINQTIGYLRTVITFFPLLGLQFLGATYFQAVGKKIPSLILGISRQFLILPPLVLLLPLFFKLQGIWLAFPTADILAVIITLAALWKELNQLNQKKNIQEQK